MQDGGDDFRNDSALLPRHEAGAHRITRSAQRPGRTRRPGKTSACRFDHDSARERGASAKASIASPDQVAAIHAVVERAAQSGPATRARQRLGSRGRATRRVYDAHTDDKAVEPWVRCAVLLGRGAQSLSAPASICTSGPSSALVPVRAEQAVVSENGGRALGTAARARA